MRELEIKGKKIGSGHRPLVCVPLMGANEESVDKHLQAIVEEMQHSLIDIIEFRGDFFEGLDDFNRLSMLLEKVRMSLTNQILLFTIRSPKEGGYKRDYSKVSIEEINSFVVKNELADMVDVELYSVTGDTSSVVQLAKSGNVKIIMSNHDFEKTPDKETMVSRLVRMQEMGADVAKIAVMPKSQEDLLELLSATYEMKNKHQDTPVVTMSMGAMGALSRVTGELFGSAITFGTVGEASAPGQIPVKELNLILESMHNYCID